MKERLAGLPVVGTAMAVQRRTKADAADQFGAAIAFHGFISLFPLIAVVTAVAGLVLSDLDVADVDTVVNSIQEAIPGLGGDTIDGVFDAVMDNARTLGLIGLAGALYTGLRVTKAAQTATQFVFGVDLANVSAIKDRALQLGSLVVLGVLAIVGVAGSGWVQGLAQSTDVAGGRLAPIGALLGSAVLDVLLFWVAYRLYSTGSGMTWRGLLPGAIFGGVGWAALKYFGGAYLAQQADNSVVTGDAAIAAGDAALAVLGTVIGLLLVFYLAGRLYVYGAELSAELAGVGGPQLVDEGEDDRDDEPREDLDETVAGDRLGLLAALEAHERRRGVPSPRRDSEAARTALFRGDKAQGDAAARQAGPADAGPDDADVVPATIAPSELPSAVEATADEATDDEATAQEATARVATARVATAGLPSTDGAGAVAREADVVPAAAGTGPSDREIVPWRAPAEPTAMDDPVVRRIAGAAAVGLVGVAVGLWRRRNRG